MPFKSSSIVPQSGGAKSTNSRSSPKTAISSVAGSTTSQTENSNDSLVIEDLDLADLDVCLSTVRSYSPSQDDGSSDDCFLYPDVDVNNFFGEQIPAVVSEACLMNDLYILVKVPTNPKNHVPTSTTATQTTPKSSRLSPNLCINTNRKIFPIQEEEEEHTVQEHRSRIPVQMRPRGRKPCWVNESDTPEEFASTTNILHYDEIVPLPNQVPEQPEVPLHSVNPINRGCSPSCQNQIELHEVNLDSARFKGHANVSLENYGILITPTKTPTTENLLVFQVDTEPKQKPRAKSHACFEWLTKIFRRNRTSTGYVHAKVYKTYFVKWRHSSDNDNSSKCQCRTTKFLRRNSA